MNSANNLPDRIEQEDRYAVCHLYPDQNVPSVSNNGIAYPRLQILVQHYNLVSVLLDRKINIR